MVRVLVTICLMSIASTSGLQTACAQDSSDGLNGEIDRLTAEIEGKIIAWRRDVHEHPELSNRETRTAQLVAEHLKSLGLEVQTGIAHTGVVGLLKGGKPGRVVALRADMDALPVTERTDVPFASKVRSTYNGRDVGVMHACGHDAHVAILMGVAEVLASVKDDIPGTVKFIFQPAEEGAPRGEEGGASLMVAQGVLVDPRPEAIFGLHVTSRFHTGQIGYRAKGSMASSDSFSIVVEGTQTHGAVPWRGVDPITTAAQIVLGLQTITSRQLDLTASPAVISVGMIEGGVRSNIIPDDVRMLGTIRTLDPEMRPKMHERIRHTAETIASAAGAKAKVEIRLGAPVTYNDPDLVEATVPSLQRVAGGKQYVVRAPQATGAEDFAFYQEVLPGMFYYIGVTPPEVSLDEAAPNHSPLFYIDEAALQVGARSLANVAVDFLMAE